MTLPPLIAVTAGDVAGIGPELLIRACRDDSVSASCRPFVLCNPELLERAAKLCPEFPVPNINTVPRLPTCREELESHFEKLSVPGTAAGRSELLCFNPAGDEAASAPPNRVSREAGHAAFQYLSSAIGLAQSGVVDAIATAPLNKAALHAAGHHFPGHTEILAEQCGVSDFAMMLHLPESRIAPLRHLVRSSTDADWTASHGLSIAHVTLHTSIDSVPQLLTTAGIVDKVRLMHRFLDRIGCARKAIAVCALNPHAGEDGLFGDEEARIIEPAVRHFDRTEVHVSGPLPVDTLIRRAVTGEFDGVIAMYHDQGHIPVKLIGFDAAVNITLGLPIVRTSPTHGTAFDRAWNSATPADPSGMIEALLTAAKLARPI